MKPAPLWFRLADWTPFINTFIGKAGIGGTMGKARVAVSVSLLGRGITVGIAISFRSPPRRIIPIPGFVKIAAIVQLGAKGCGNHRVCDSRVIRLKFRRFFPRLDAGDIYAKLLVLG